MNSLPYELEWLKKIGWLCFVLTLVVGCVHQSSKNKTLVETIQSDLSEQESVKVKLSWNVEFSEDFSDVPVGGSNGPGGDSGGPEGLIQSRPCQEKQARETQTLKPLRSTTKYKRSTDSGIPQKLRSSRKKTQKQRNTENQGKPRETPGSLASGRGRPLPGALL